MNNTFSLDEVKRNPGKSAPGSAVLPLGNDNWRT